MEGYVEEIRSFLHRTGKTFTEITAEDITVFDEKGGAFSLIAVPVHEKTPEEADIKRQSVWALREAYPGAIILAEDRWRRSGPVFRKRIEAHLGLFRPVFARNCTVLRIDRPTADSFFGTVHSYGTASARHSYGIITKKDMSGVPAGSLVAAASFSNARRIEVGGHTVASHEWVRYASLPDVRILGGMGRLLKAFIREVHPDDVMSYADREWSDGRVYRELGFREDGGRAPVLFSVDPLTWKRTPLGAGQPIPENGYYWMNGGSVKFRLTLHP